MRAAARMAKAAFAAAAFATLAASGGCMNWYHRHFSDRELVTTGLGERPARLVSQLPYCWYENDPAQVSLYLSDIPLEDLVKGGQLTGTLVHLQLVWLPRPGWTPVQPSSTNTVIRTLVFSDGEVGLYGGGGFSWPWDEPGDPSFGLQMTGSSLSLLKKTSGFVDLLSPAEMLGIVEAPLDAASVIRVRAAASQMITDAFRDPTWVRIWEGAPGPMDANPARDARVAWRFQGGAEAPAGRCGFTPPAAAAPGS